MDMTAGMQQSIGGIRVEPRPSCMICGSDGEPLYDALLDHQYGVSGQWSLRKCRSKICGLVWQDPMITAGDLPLAYKSYYTHGNPSSFSSDNFWGRSFSFLDRRIASVLGLVPERNRYRNGFLDDCPPGSLLDIGCGNGDFAANMRLQGWSVRGTDADPEAAGAVARTHGFEVDVGELTDLAYPGESLDAVTARHVIEHIREPEAFLRECWRILKPGGRLVLVTPNVASLGHQIYRQHWQGLEPPRHMFLYDTRTLHALARSCDIESLSLFSTAQGASYIFRSSERIRVGHYDAARSFARTLLKYWYWLFLEVRALRNGRMSCGEELVLIADKPHPTGAPVPRTSLRTQTC
ncbi:MAG: class I SAM-dependent methyltransferase [Burkholderiales bacterium]|nr:class I SAM-dependent methyltransferase [Burkholderiales bacterium]MDP2398596.1 class I SAM-dependent methyltransferase [Burkholderiales bacterium]